MDTLKEKNYLEELWGRGNAPWKIWDKQPVEAKEKA
jgi:glucose-1-phosphate cytidylyltransferase